MQSPNLFKNRINGILILLYLGLGTPKPTRAEDSIAYKYEDYQEDNDRIRVVAHYVRVEKELSLNTSIGVVGLIDTITGSTPTGVPITADDENQVPLANLEDKRKSIILNLDHKSGDNGYAFELSYSDESDYESKGASFSYKREFNKNNTTFQTGYSVLDDELTAVALPETKNKNSNDYFIGLSQVIDPHTILTANISYGKENGYLGDPYKSVQKTVEILPGFFLPILFPENRPGTRDKWVFFTELQRDFEKLNGSLQGSYRFFSDDAGIDSHTWTLEWFQRLSEKFILAPMYRYYNQSAADFYYYNLDDAAITPERDNVGQAPYYSSDHRLSHMETHTYGAKLIWFINEDWELNLKYSRYEMKGLDGVTHPSAYSDANILTVGGRFWF